MCIYYYLSQRVSVPLLFDLFEKFGKMIPQRRPRWGEGGGGVGTRNFYQKDSFRTNTTEDVRVG